MRFHNRVDAGRQLAGRLTAFAGRPDVVVLGLPRGGVPVAHEVATRLQAPLDVWLVRKLGVPGHPELAMGAIATGGIEVLSTDLIRDLGIPQALVQKTALRERLELERRDVLYRAGRRPVALRDLTVILVDDGLATGSTVQGHPGAASTRRRARGRRRSVRNLRAAALHRRRGRLCVDPERSTPSAGGRRVRADDGRGSDPLPAAA